MRVFIIQTRVLSARAHLFLAADALDQLLPLGADLVARDGLVAAAADVQACGS
jgi:hypothetical protein